MVSAVVVSSSHSHMKGKVSISSVALINCKSLVTLSHKKGVSRSKDEQGSGFHCFNSLQMNIRNHDMDCNGTKYMVHTCFCTSFLLTDIFLFDLFFYIIDALFQPCLTFVIQHFHAT